MGAWSICSTVALGICGGVFGLIFVLFYIAYLIGIPIASIVIGALYLDDCPLQRLIPVYLIVSGVLGPVFGIFERCRSALCTVETAPGQRETIPNAYGYCGYFTAILLGLVWTGLFILGNVLVYGTYDVVSSNSTSVEYCHPTAYYFTFWSITSFYILLGFSLVVFSCCFAVGICYALMAKE
ncbi:transmembrane protein 272-like [Saccostrea echinata]|uniref:transmembrane protein 272-like n=1 Tax=Saccostrea echinata TaxID=191078 RepID=UPI002A7F027B|nr:transmembrane protein 272-like [Saccostrea echinata]